MDRYDIAIVGTGPAGLEAAITAKVRNKNVLLLGPRDLSMKVEKAHMISNYLGLPMVSGDEMQKSFKDHLERMEIAITEDRVNMVYPMGKYFALQGHKNMYEATSVILACGTSIVKPFPGEIECLGRGVSYCATCDAVLYRGKTAIVLGYSPEEEKEALFLSEIADKVYYLPMYQQNVSINSDKIEVLIDKKPLTIELKEHRVLLKLENDCLEADGLFILRENIPPAQMVPGLEIENNCVKVNRGMETNVQGLFACGDITGAPYQYMKAAGEGNVAALSAVGYLSNLA